MSSYVKVEAAIKTAFESYGVVNDVEAARGDKLAKKIVVNGVGISGSPDPDNIPHRLTASVIGTEEKKETPPDRFDAAIKIQDLRELNEDQVREVTMAVLKAQFAKVTLADGSNLADKYDFSSAPIPEQTDEQKAAKLRTQISDLLAKSPGIVPQDVAGVILKSRTLNPDPQGDCYYGWSGVNAKDGHVQVNFDINNSKEAGEKSRVALTKENILARKDAILDGIREAVKKAHAGSVPDAELQNLDLQVDVNNNEYGGDVCIRIGTKFTGQLTSQQQADGYQPVGPTALAGLTEENLHRIVSDSVLFKGQGATDIAANLIGRKDISRLLGLYKDKIPGIEDVLKSEELYGRWSLRSEEKRKKEEKIRPKISIDTSLHHSLKAQDTVHILTELPEGLDHSALIAQLADKAQMVASTVAPAPAPTVSVSTNATTQTATNAAPAVPANQTTTGTNSAEPPKFANENLKAPVLTAPLPESAVDRLAQQPPSSKTLGG